MSITHWHDGQGKKNLNVTIHPCSRQNVCCKNCLVRAVQWAVRSAVRSQGVAWLQVSPKAKRFEVWFVCFSSVLQFSKQINHAVVFWCFLMFSDFGSQHSLYFVLTKGPADHLQEEGLLAFATQWGSWDWSPAIHCTTKWSHEKHGRKDSIQRNCEGEEVKTCFSNKKGLCQKGQMGKRLRAAEAVRRRKRWA